MTRRDFISKIAEGLNSTRLDDRLPSKYLYTAGVDMAQVIIKREIDSRRLYNDLSSFRKFDCFKLRPVAPKECNVQLVCSSIMKSVLPLPKSFTSGYGSVVLVFSGDESYQIIQSNPSSYSSIMKREFKSKNDVYFWVGVDNHIYIPNSSVDTIVVYGLFYEDLDKGGCTGFLDEEINIPGHLVSDIVKHTVADIANSNKRIPADEDSNLNSNDKI